MADRERVYWTDSEINDLIDEWHDAADGSTAAGVSLLEYLGISWEEYTARFGPEDRHGANPGRRLTEEGAGSG